VCILLAGRHAGKKAIIVKHQDDGTKEKKFGHALVVGIERNPLKVTKRMSSKRIEKRSKLKPFVKYVNFNHLLPTRYTVQNEFDFKATVSSEKMANSESRKQMKKEVKKMLNEKYKTTGTTADKTSHAGFFFKKLRF